MKIRMSDAAAAAVLKDFVNSYVEIRKEINEADILKYETVREALEIAVQRLLQTDARQQGTQE